MQIQQSANNIVSFCVRGLIVALFVFYSLCSFPVQISIEVIKRRLENNYYRTVEAVKNDASTMVSFAESYFGKIGDQTNSNRIHRLRKWIENIFNDL